ncbi:predicted protein [Nematostella vectensis]|uniref:UMOD/GP2/OIT3-like D8C domain-containing protein n=1 Tax=Nematostella vectensis TaxID=45351 RepID=A7RPI2_NEMVE|nr:predicted protein [Nematostella vectensis]|eukprot:XP_001638638.1 predicted protein [Nematostella vectensis]
MVEFGKHRRKKGAVNWPKLLLLVNSIQSPAQRKNGDENRCRELSNFMYGEDVFGGSSTNKVDHLGRWFQRDCFFWLSCLLSSLTLSTSLHKVFALLYGCLAKENTQESSNTEDEKLDIKPRAYYPPSECRSYTMLHGADRAMANTAQNALRCDKNEFPGNLWYRFTGQAGNAMPTSCVLEKRCGTHAPGWMVGAHPTVAQGMVTRKVCYHWTKNCCRWSNYIKVRNCGAFYVYQLPKTPVCWLRYCGNGIPQPPECRRYTVFNSFDRAIGNTAQNSLKCDQRDLPGNLWYRFLGAAGNAMPTSCVPVKRCGTHAPGWIVGSHPSLRYSLVTRKVCYHWSGSCCRWSNYIKVRNCGGFYVYQLPKTPVCWLRYCGNRVSLPPPPPECRRYTVFNRFDRAIGNTAQNSLKCDQRDLPGNLWYRFLGAAGNAMPTSCVPVRRCGTHAPGWMVGSHPSLRNSLVTRKVCYHWSGSCCRWSNNIKVRNCGGFYVYQLPKTPVCMLRYCGRGY